MRVARWAVLWTALIALSSAPALAQDATAANGEAARDVDVQFVDCSQVINVIQGQYGDASALGRRAVATVAREQGVTIEQVNACLGNDGSEETTEEATDEEAADDVTTDEEAADETTTTETVDTDDEGDVIVGTVPDVDELPDTGGPSLLAVGAGLALVAGGALIRFRR